MATFLLAQGADPQIRNKKGLTVIQVARQRGLIEPAELIDATDA